MSDKKEQVKHIDWGAGFGQKQSNGVFIGVDPNNYFQQNLQFLSGQPNPSQTPEQFKKPIFRLAFLLTGGKDQLAKTIHVENATNPAEIDNVPQDYYNVTNKGNIDNVSVYFIDVVFDWRSNPDGSNTLTPRWINHQDSDVTVKEEPKFQPGAKRTKAAGQGADGRPWFNMPGSVTKNPNFLKTMGVFHLRPWGTPKNGQIYTDSNAMVPDFWNKLLASYDYSTEQFSKIYTIWFHKKIVGFNILDEIFSQTTFAEIQLSHFKDICLNKKVIDLFELSDLISPNDRISAKNDIFLLFTKWLNYKNAAMISVYDQYNEKYFKQQNTSIVDINYFKRLDDFIFYSVKCFINILDNCLLDNHTGQVGSKGIILKEFFESDFALGGTNQTTKGKKLSIESDALYEEEDQEKPKAKKASTKKPAKKVAKKAPAKKATTKKTSKKSNKKGGK